MATIYRFIVENKVTGGSGDGRKSSSADSGISKKTTAKKGRYVSIIGGSKGGVEHNRKMRAVNPLLNKITHGYYEKGMRAGRAAMGLFQRNTETGKLGISGTALTILISLMITTLLKWQNIERQKAQQANAQNYKMLENGFGAVRGAYDISVNFWTGERTYNQNK